MMKLIYFYAFRYKIRTPVETGSTAECMQKYAI